MKILKSLGWYFNCVFLYFGFWLETHRWCAPGTVARWSMLIWILVIFYLITLTNWKSFFLSLLWRKVKVICQRKHAASFCDLKCRKKRCLVCSLFWMRFASRGKSPTTCCRTRSADTRAGKCTNLVRLMKSHLTGKSQPFKQNSMRNRCDSYQLCHE